MVYGFRAQNLMVYGFWNQTLMVYGYQLFPKNLWFMVFRHKSMEKRHCFILSSIKTTNFLRVPRESPPRYIFSYNFGSLQFSQKLSSHSDYLSPLITFSLPATCHHILAPCLILSHSILAPRILLSHSGPHLLSSHSGYPSSHRIPF